MLNHVRKCSDQRLLRIAYDVGQEIDRRWHHEAGRKTVQFKDCMDVFVYFHYRLWDKKQEQLIMLMLDTRHALIEERIVTLGTINSSLIHAREIFAPAIEKRATAIVLVHNHPSGNATPSRQDLQVMERLKKVGNLIDIPILDQLVIGRYQYYSENLKKVIYI